MADVVRLVLGCAGHNGMDLLFHMYNLAIRLFDECSRYCCLCKWRLVVRFHILADQSKDLLLHCVLCNTAPRDTWVYAWCFHQLLVPHVRHNVPTQDFCKPPKLWTWLQPASLHSIRASFDVTLPRLAGVLLNFLFNILCLSLSMIGWCSTSTDTIANLLRYSCLFVICPGMGNGMHCHTTLGYQLRRLSCQCRYFSVFHYRHACLCKLLNLELFGEHDIHVLGPLGNISIFCFLWICLLLKIVGDLFLVKGMDVNKKTATYCWPVVL